MPHLQWSPFVGSRLLAVTLTVSRPIPPAASGVRPRPGRRQEVHRLHQHRRDVGHHRRRPLRGGLRQGEGDELRQRDAAAAAPGGLGQPGQRRAAQGTRRSGAEQRKGRAGQAPSSARDGQVRRRQLAPSRPELCFAVCDAASF